MTKVVSESCFANYFSVYGICAKRLVILDFVEREKQCYFYL